MKLKLITLALGVLMAQGAFANGTQASPAPQPNPAAAHNIPQTPEQWLERMTDFTRNASAYRDPKVFVPWSNAVTEPGFYTQMGVNMMEPNNWYSHVRLHDGSPFADQLHAVRRSQYVRQVDGRFHGPQLLHCTDDPVG